MTGNVFTWETLLADIEEGIKQGTMLAIEPRDRLYLKTGGEANAPRFAENFKKVWLALPEHDRRATKAFWAGRISFGRPLLEYSNGWAPKQAGVYATAEGGCEIQFVAKLLDAMPDEAVRFIIAHELAHVYQKARGDKVHRSDSGGHYYTTPSGERRTVEQNEANANDLAMTWGFFPLELIRWENGNN